MVGRPFKKGKSGNPGGRPRKIAEIRAAAQEHARDAIDALVKIVKTGKSESARVAAASAILDRGYGKPPQTLNANIRRSVAEVSDAELAAIALGRSTGVAEAERREGESDRVH